MKHLFILLFAFPAILYANKSHLKKSKPNIIIIYADDMGYGDLHCQNINSKIPTPNLDKLASEGMRFTDAHSSSGICSPSRFALLTGAYHWRRQHGIVGSFGTPLFIDSDVTLPQVLGENGYTTACIGKWHLGWHWNFKSKPTGTRKYWGKDHSVYLPQDIDWEGPIKGGPLDRGFDYYFGDGTINFPPYAWIENENFVETPNDFFEFDQFKRKAKEGDWDSRPGPKVKGWDPYQVLPTITQKTIAWINKQNQEQAFFLYLALPSPHMPIIPNDAFDGTSKAGAYGDYMYQTDHITGEILEALKKKGFEENTIIIFSSDNGPESTAWERAVQYNHFSMGDFRGLKRDVWEGGHHVPFIVKWTKEIKAGSVSDEVVCQTDIMSTIAEITEIELPAHAAPDSYSLLAVLKENKYKSPLREATIHNTSKSTWAIRKGDWLFINSNSGSGARKPPESFVKLKKYSNFKTKGLLFDMSKDKEQRVNLYSKKPNKVKELDELLKKYRNSTSTKKKLSY